MEPTFVFLIDPERVVSSGWAIVDHGVRVVVDPVGTEDAQRPHAVLELGRGLSKLLRLVPRPRRGLCEDPVPEAAAHDREHDEAEEEDDEKGDQGGQVWIEIRDRRG